tara:strand:- start:650 stop:1066 length:417 start_codon:yes stop_codon:yes gene_type:complete
MNWLAFKKAIKKAWIWTKTHWYLPILFLSFIIALLIWAISRNGAAMAALFDVWESSRASYDEQLSVLEGTHEEEIKERDKILEEYGRNLKKIEEEHGEDSEKLASDKKKELEELIEKGYGDPDELAKKIAELYGLENG